MKKLFPFMLFGLSLHCNSQRDQATLQIGNIISFSSNGELNVSGSTTFTKKDTVVLFLLQQKPFGFPILTYSLYKLESGNKQKLKEEYIKMEPGVRFLRNKFPASELIQKYGYGSFFVQFHNGKSLVAEKEYKIVSQ